MTRLFAAPKGEERDSESVRKLLRHAVWEMYGIPLPEIQKTDEGKPFFPDRPDIFFSLSHTLRYVLCAVSDFPVGCDIETERKISSHLQMRVCAESEIAQFDFFDSWVLKESYIKLKGRLTDNYIHLVFSRKDGALVAPEPEVCARLYPKIESCHIGLCCIGCLPPDRTEYISEL